VSGPYAFNGYPSMQLDDVSLAEWHHLDVHGCRETAEWLAQRIEGANPAQLLGLSRAYHHEAKAIAGHEYTYCQKCKP